MMAQQIEATSEQWQSVPWQSVQWQNAGEWQYLPLAQQLGEGLCYDDNAGLLWWTDIRGQQVCCLRWQDNRLCRFTPPVAVTALALTQVPGQLIVAFLAGFALYQPFSGQWQVLSQLVLPAGQRLNDGRLDRQGRMLAGAMHDDGNLAAQASLYRLTAAAGSWQTEVVLSGLNISNGLCFSPDGRFMYHADSPARQIRRYAYAEAQTGNGELFCQIEPPGYPDGAYIDRHGRLWTALWGAGLVECYQPDGQRFARFAMPVSQPTCPLFAGPAGDYLVVSSAWDGLNAAQLAAEPLAGALWRRQLQPLALPAEPWLAGFISGA